MATRARQRYQRDGHLPVLRFMEIEAELEALAEGRVVNGDLERSSQSSSALFRD
jgi:hypothetical protein